MKNHISTHLVKAPLALAACAFLDIASAHAASVLWSYQTVPDGLSGTSTSAVSYSTGYQTDPSFAGLAGSGGATYGLTSGGAANYYYAPNNTTYGGSGTSSGAGFSTVWQAATTSLFTGAGFTVALDTRGLADLTMSFSMRAASSLPAQGLASSNFATMEYSLNGGGSWTSLGLTSPTWPSGASGTAAYNAVSLDLSSVDAIENQSSVLLRYIFSPGTKTGSTTETLRMDNLVVNAVPEPSTAVLFGLAGCGVALFLRRARLLGRRAPERQ